MFWTVYGPHRSAPASTPSIDSGPWDAAQEGSFLDDINRFLDSLFSGGSRRSGQSGSRVAFGSGGIAIPLEPGDDTGGMTDPLISIDGGDLVRQGGGGGTGGVLPYQPKPGQSPGQDVAPVPPPSPIPGGQPTTVISMPRDGGPAGDRAPAPDFGRIGELGPGGP